MTPFTPKSDIWFVFHLLACRYIYNSRLLLSEELWWSEPVTKSPSHFFSVIAFLDNGHRRHQVSYIIDRTLLFWRVIASDAGAGRLSDRRRFRSRWEIRLVFGFLTDSTMRKGCPWNNDEVCPWIWTFFVCEGLTLGIRSKSNHQVWAVGVSRCGWSWVKSVWRQKRSCHPRNEICLIWPTRARGFEGTSKRGAIKKSWGRKMGKKERIRAGNQSLTPPIRHRD